MSLVSTLKLHSDKVGEGIHRKRVSDLEARLDVELPDDFKEYLTELNYAELYGDPIYGINPNNKMLDLYSQNRNTEHFRYGFFEIFANDIDGTIYIRPDTGAVYNACFNVPVAKSFSEFVKVLLSESGGS